MSKAEDFKALRALFQAWVKEGVPPGIDYPRTQSECVGWSCEQFGIRGVSSKREFRSNHPEYGEIVIELKALIGQLRPVGEVRGPDKDIKSTKKTQKARRISAEGETKRHRFMLEATLTQLHEARQELSSLRQQLTVERQLSASLRLDVTKLDEENATLKRRLASGGGLLQLVE